MTAQIIDIEAERMKRLIRGHVILPSELTPMFSMIKALSEIDIAEKKRLYENEKQRVKNTQMRQEANRLFEIATRNSKMPHKPDYTCDVKTTRWNDKG